MRFGGKDFWQNMRKSEAAKKAVEFSDFKSETYKEYEFHTYTKDGKPILFVYKGQSGKPISRYYYRSEEHRQDAINEFKKTADSRDKYKKEKKEAQKTLVNPFNVGDVLYSTWGYDQTNVDFYKVVGVLPKSIKIVSVGQVLVEATGWLQETVIADPTRETGEVMLKRVTANRKYVSINSYAVASKWDGHPIHQSHYH